MLLFIGVLKGIWKSQDIAKLIVSVTFAIVLVALCFYCWEQVIIFLPYDSDLKFSLLFKSDSLSAVWEYISNYINSDSFQDKKWLYAKTFFLPLGAIIYTINNFLSLQNVKKEINLYYMLFIFYTLVILFFWFFEINYPFDLKLELINKSLGIYTENVKNFLMEQEIYTKELNQYKEQSILLLRLTQLIFGFLVAEWLVINRFAGRLSTFHKLMIVVTTLILSGIIFYIYLESGASGIASLYFLKHNLWLNNVANHPDIWSSCTSNNIPYEDCLDSQDREALSFLNKFGNQGGLWGLVIFLWVLITAFAFFVSSSSDFGLQVTLEETTNTPNDKKNLNSAKTQKTDMIK